MFGILAPCSSRTPADLRPRWMGHYCGLCLELRDDAGHFSRLTANYDALALSVLVEAQQGPDEAEGRTAGPCALRGMRRQRIAAGDGPRLAAAASLLLASAKLRDHVEDGDGIAARPAVAGLAARAAGRYRSKALAIAASIDLSVEPIMDAVDRQQAVEDACGPDTPLPAITAPTERATADLFAHAAVLGGKEENIGPLRSAGGAFGRLAHLMDAAEDFEGDAERGAWNPLAATGTSLGEAASLARGALADVRAAIEAASFTDTTMVRLLFDRYAAHAVAKTFGSTCATYRRPDHRSGHREYRDDMGRETMPRGFWAGLCVGIGLCCSCQCCCKERYEGPWSRKPREGCCHKCDCCECYSCECCPCD